MRTALSVLLLATLTLTACQSRYNPINWFGNDTEVQATSEAEGEINPLVPNGGNTENKGIFSKRPEPVYAGTILSQVASVKVHRIPEGAMIEVVGVSNIHGVHSLKLDPQNEGEPVNGVLTYNLLGVHPKGGYTGGSQQSREVTVAHVLTTEQLSNVRTIRVVAAQNARETRR
ncbi:hypothetical protein [Shimia haliotis]|uniref:Outer membrane lipoprotein n=1 Tax=Shimia haliotis TaxID=1280847 RepID=A0A1I4AWH7_9RHOB|nr:hypothetical protein [Shimia haliotis]SFK59986.1 hypothetical protein SAMN04488036_101604 [Shimia haliotis]